MKEFNRSYKDIITVENILHAWRKFLRDKHTKKDVILFQLKLMDNLYDLFEKLKNRTYVHGPYKKRNISDPKPRIIHAASVQDRVLHHLLYEELYPFCDKKFVFDSYSCRNQKGTHRALYRFKSFARTVSRNNTNTCWVLKCDVRKFFASVDHTILRTILRRYFHDEDILWLLEKVIESFHTEGKDSIGLPLGNLTSQLLVNIYMHEFDFFVKNTLKAKHYIRYADDFVILSSDKRWLEELLPSIGKFLLEKLGLYLHPGKVEMRTLSSGVDLLGWVNFPHHAVLRTTTKRRMLKNINEKTVASYAGMLKHGNAFGLRSLVEKLNTTSRKGEPPMI